ncbi:MULTISPECIES: alpha/beta fold hydrolase [unclassified Legionella]|uniref:alpha/beta fold hydrolase n=1 Tax=unclassified Legionella TaxID=2622702 RepID=UPI0010553BE2|nr:MULTISPECIES: alpha/beta hydrolase [unclassified Legionella]MDI9818383.1 alpha/beta hydrolase [Legionella sp. PL877]
MKQDYFLGASPEGFHKVVYSEWGKSNGQQSAVICVHGLTRNRHDFDPLASFLSLKDYHVFCPDIVGRGDSGWLKNANLYNYRQYIIDMNNLIARTGAKQIDWIGTSMGGLMGIILAALPNSPVRSLVLNDISPQIPVEAIRRLGEYVGKYPEFSSEQEAKQYFQSIYTSFGPLSEEQWEHITKNSIQTSASGSFMVKIDPKIKETKTKSQILRELFSHPRRALEGILFDIDLWHLWQAVKCPVLVIHGKNSDILLPEHIEKMQKTHPNVNVIEIENAGHAPALFAQTEHEKISTWLAHNR